MGGGLCSRVHIAPRTIPAYIYAYCSASPVDKDEIGQAASVGPDNNVPDCWLKQMHSFTSFFVHLLQLPLF